MTKLLFQKDSYLQEFPAIVKKVDPENQAIILDRTAFYPGGGGQPADSGLIKYGEISIPIKRARKAGPDILHIVEYGFDLPETEQDVNGQLDWEHRYKLMRTHTALHILCGVIWRDYGALVTGGNMKPLAARMDFELEHMSVDFAQEVEVKINAEVAAARAVKTYILPREEAFQIPDLIRTKINLLPEGIREVRVVEIEGLDMQADGGTHVANTSEVGTIHVVGHESKGRINKRLRIALEG